MACSSPPGSSRRTALLAGTAAALSACGFADDAETPLPPGPPRGRVVLLRGLANVFSTGMDELEEKLRLADYDASVHNHLDWRDQAGEIIELAQAGRLARPFAVIGHSLGADDGIRLAAQVGQASGVMDLLVTFDPVLVGSVPPGPRHVRNYFQQTGLWGRGVTPGRGFNGILENRPVQSDNHFTIDKDPVLHQEVMALLAATQPGAAPVMIPPPRRRPSARP